MIRIFNLLVGANKQTVAFQFGKDIINRTLDSTKADWGEFYVANTRGIALALIAEYPNLSLSFLQLFII